jgi:hypothetical protein
MTNPPGKGQTQGPAAKVVVTDPAAALLLVGTGAAVIVAGVDAAAVGAAVVALRAAGADAAGWVGDPSDSAVLEMAAELFPGSEVVLRPPGGLQGGGP